VICAVPSASPTIAESGDAARSSRRRLNTDGRGACRERIYPATALSLTPGGSRAHGRPHFTAGAGRYHCFFGKPASQFETISARRAGPASVAFRSDGA
jgi:hypothetical protein